MNIPRLPSSRLSTLEEGYSEQEEVPTDQVPQAESKEVVRSTIYPQRTESVKMALHKARATYYSSLIKELLSSPTDPLRFSSTSSV